MSYGDEMSDIEHDQMQAKVERTRRQIGDPSIEVLPGRTLDALIKTRAERDEWRKSALAQTTALEYAHAALAQQADDLTAYKDYYGTSVAQVRHLATCVLCAEADTLDESKRATYRCPDYPME